ncbi:Phosphatidylinositol 4,5-bisphosphate 3-kinase catalytic subunit alpha isoform-like [Oopsacas minuta]|uniref:Phosphatidylinositol 4,5-bisphosphate 3-kinase catalytic subunit alpha isoform-like n=1 Tax=Oopsacas minuta TaxID=111878 RepID=A0AAV7K666_9METZ|nr:Phosphatidylinositol 4,5-bisphosphate 3-kinase catalytic subunit alpha isoform-like [Oopsacas minuta]
MSMNSDPPALPKKTDIIYGSVSSITADLHFMLPSGIYLPMKALLSATLAEVKERLFEEASKDPINRILKHKSFYLFIAINKNGIRQECGDESKRLSELELYRFFFKVQERVGNVEDKIIDGTIGLLISKNLSEFNIMGGEVQECRRNLVNTVEKVLRQRGSDSHLLARYYYPPKVASGEILPDLLMETLTEDGKFNAIFYISQDGKQSNTEMRILVPACASVNQVVFNVLNPTLPVQQEHEMDHVLKVLGESSYFLDGHVEIIRYKHVRNALMRGEELRFKVIPLKVLYDSLPRTKFIKPVYADAMVPIEKGTTSLWSINPEITYFITIKWISSTNLPENYKLQLQACLYHGDRIISEIINTPEYKFDNDQFDFRLEFPVPVCSMPRSTKLCFNLTATSDNSKGLTLKRFKKPIFTALAWANMMVFDYHGILINGHQTLHMRRYEEEPEECFNYIGTTDSHVVGTTMQKIVLEIDIPIFHRTKVKYPDITEITNHAYQVNPGLKKGTIELGRMYTSDHIDKLKKIINTDRLVELEEIDLQYVWDLRLICSTCEESLPKLLTACDWSNRDSVAEIEVILQRWPEISINTALELLDYSFADRSVRDFAVKNLSQQLTDDYFAEYLLQLVQVLKYEPYLYCSLAVMLLEKSLWNAHIGHFLFWHLRAEMHLPELSVRYGILLESYCRGAGAYTQQLDLQIRALKKMKQLTDNLQTQGGGYTQDKLREKLQEYSDGKIFTMASPLNPTFLLDGLQSTKCKYMDSKMKPLWMVFNNQEQLGKSVYQIFKNGDDLRQDMITIQLFRIMDSLWQDQGLDLRLSPYGCLSTGNQIGMIEIVLNSYTLAKIHKKYGGGAKGAFSSQSLYNYLVDANKDSKQIDNAIKNFTLSCAGYCVATFVLGIGDRHSDNIMMKENGQLFHIDFGHFLGNFKSKFGIKRERVPFVLTRDFLYIICRGREHTDAVAIPHMTGFRNLCERGYLILRQNASLFINLLSMMLSTGIPELRSIEDIAYMRDALCLDESESTARDFFRAKFAEAINNSITVSINWYIHGIARKS